MASIEENPPAVAKAFWDVVNGPVGNTAGKGLKAAINTSVKVGKEAATAAAPAGKWAAKQVRHCRERFYGLFTRTALGQTLSVNQRGGGGGGSNSGIPIHTPSSFTLLACGAHEHLIPSLHPSLSLSLSLSPFPVSDSLSPPPLSLLPVFIAVLRV